MLLKKEGFPEEDELVLCTVTKIFHHSVFVNVDEYGRGGMIHISEVSPGRIRNIRDFVKEDKKIVCKVLRINEEKGHIDLSLRRVNEGQKRHKINEVKQEQKSEKIIELLALKLSKDLNELYKEITLEIFKKYSSLYSCFEDVVKDNISLEKIGIAKEISDSLTPLIKERMKPVEVSVKGELRLTSYALNGVEIIKKVVKKAEDINKEKITISYEGGGKYRIEVKASEYKDAEKILDDSVNTAISFIEEQDGEGEFVKEET